MTDSASPATPDLWSDLWTEADRDEVRRLQGPIWVVGAAGFIGAKLFFSLSRIRTDVYAVSRQAENSWRLLHSPYGNRLNLDITRAQEVVEAVRRHQPKTVFNLSAYGAYERQSQVRRIHEVNYLGTLNLVQALAETGCDAFVHAGTSSEYGLNCAAPGEDDRLEPNSDYAVSKAATSYLLGYYGRLRSFPSTHLRLYSVYGPWEERDRLIPTVVRLGLQGKYPPFVDPAISRDFVYVDDCTRAFVKAALTSCRQNPGRSYNIATGTKTTLADVAANARRQFSIPAEPVFGSMSGRKWDLANWYGNPARAQAELGWEHRVGFAQGLDVTAAWEQAAEPHVRFAAVAPKTEKLSAVVACYRDHEAIPHMHERLTTAFRKLGVDYEIIFVNDRSPTNDEEVIRTLCSRDAHVIGISHSRNFGSQSAFISGMEVATGDAVVLLDGDLQDTPETIESFYAEWKKGADVVYGVRIKRQAAWHMQVFYKAFYRLLRRLSDVEMPVDAGDFSLIDRKVVEHLLRFPERDVFVRGLRAWVGFKQTGVPYVRPERMFGRTTNNFLKNIWWAKKAIFSFSLKPLHYIQGIGVVIFGLSMVLSAFYLAYYLINPPQNAPGITTIILLVLGLGGIQLLSLSILGDYLGKVLEETKGRPRFIRARIFSSRGELSNEVEIGRYLAELRHERSNRQC
ncbi:MAG: NAD-dependent epimerase/dehydratase family protein [Opitutaceae bacterium]|nr:NAD-dependent epimerase/dehydratase family protein [Opitutaceae bacterium]